MLIWASMRGYGEKNWGTIITCYDSLAEVINTGFEEGLMLVA